MIRTGSIVGVLLPETSIFISACGAKDLVENTTKSCAHVCASVHVMSTVGCGDPAVLDTVTCTFMGVCVCVCVSVINPW